MSDQFAENVKRLKSFSEREWNSVKKALTDGNKLLRQAGLGGISVADIDAKRGELEARGGSQAVELEAIVRLVNRPPMTIRNGKVDLTDWPRDEFPPEFDVWVRAVEPMLGSVGRIEFVNHDMDWGGTGWVLKSKDGELLVATNRHVASIVARRTHSGAGVFMYAPGGGGRYGALIDFNEEVDATPDLARPVKLLSFTYLAADDEADVAIARIDRVPQEFGVGALPLSDTDGENGELVAAIGYPARDSRNDATQMEKYFKGLYDVKRFSPGFLRVASSNTRLSHDATTLGGSSGCPLIGLKQKKVVGLHFAGRYGVGNSAVRVSTLKRILEGNKTVIPATAIDEDDEARDGTHQETDFANRGGYAPNFLKAFAVPLPDTSGAVGVRLAAPTDATKERPHELRYTNFGVLYCEQHRSPVVAAVNLDGERAVRIKRGSDRWFYDLRIPKDLQVGSDAYSEAGLDRGHMVKREDPNWGDGDIPKRANFDTFHFPNCSPQHAGFNRDLSTWRGLEDYILENARTHGFRACVFTGPILSDDLEAYGNTGLLLPREYWKVVVMPTQADDGSLVPHVTAYVLSQGEFIQKIMEARGASEAAEGFVFGAYRTFQVTVGSLEKETGLSFGDLRKFDALAIEVEGKEIIRPYVALQLISDAIV
ncbi:DNA/RNA non-specific endonuclease [Rhizobiaceae bacterium BDR2-2]|uniref:DNA/RNA non-specific endonuclease n=1 Tax=Ectorhizobium quercum TaxID=2965071 RepID=A0AAE3N2S8_9HYPH|nr:DNA/RNA non-specific endonuclease [Ectorhizobium quercum]MCX9000008.1 DNA/RNA non-specific endonuclease [Ectorhizobium quercum]